MIKEVSIQIGPDKESNSQFISQKILEALKSSGIKCSMNEIKGTVQLKKSVDARHKNIKLILRYKVFINEEPKDDSALPEWKKADGSKTVLVIGSGPAGLFGALKLLEKGIKPVIIERGKDTSSRKHDIAKISTQHLVDSNSNYCFGEGGAGTFSDGKLYTRSNKRGNIHQILSIFVHFGADPKILTDAHPHIGTDRLPKIINNMREFIISMGGEFHFETLCTDFITDSKDGTKKIIGINTLCHGESKQIEADAVLLATGHSANDIYLSLAKTDSRCLEAKTFAVGVRVEHPRSLIDAIQYHGEIQENLGAAEYRVVSQQNERGVYSFCMCPGGFVVPSATGPEEIVVNGMSCAKRNNKWSNAAIVVETKPEDIPANFTEEAIKLGSKDLAGLLWRQWLEHETFKNGQNQSAPAQRLTDFLEDKQSETLPQTSYTPGVVSSNLNDWMPKQITERLKGAFKDFNKSMKGFICSDAVLIASETRTSTPVRILRDKETFECTVIKNLFPAGEGSGYSGGIVSSAMDGVNACASISKMI